MTDRNKKIFCVCHLMMSDPVGCFESFIHVHLYFYFY
jgi:hypothetical protein